MLAEKAWIAEQVEHQASEFEEMKARWAAKAAEAKVRALSSTHRLFCVTGDLFENSSPRGTARLSSPCMWLMCSDYLRRRYVCHT